MEAERFPSASDRALAARPDGGSEQTLVLNDPVLRDLVTQSLQANASLRAVQASLQQARALRDQAAAAQGLGLTLSASAQRLERDGAGGSNSFKAGLDARWELDVWGGAAATTAAAEAEASAARADWAAARVSLVAEVALAYVDLRLAQAQQQTAQENLTSQQETLQITRWRAQAGLATQLDVEQAQTAVAQTAAQIPSLVAAQAKSRHALAVLSGQRPAALDALLATAGPVPQPTAAVPAEVPSGLLLRRPDVAAAQSRVDAALQRLQAAQAQRRPSVGLSGSLSLSALTLAGLTQGGSLAASLLGSLSVPLWDNGARWSQWLAQDAALNKAQANYQNTVLTALKEVQDALVARAQTQTRLLYLTQAAESANRAATLARQRYASGLVDFQTVLQTQRTVLSAQDALLQAQATWSGDHVRLVKALGGSWPTPDATAQPEAQAPAPPQPAELG